MAKRNGNRGASTYARATTVGNGTMSFEMDATSATKDVTVRDVLVGIGLRPRVVINNGNTPAVYKATSASTGSFTVAPMEMTANTEYYLVPKNDVLNACDAIKISSVTAAPNAGTRLPVEINFYDGQLFRCDNAMKPTKVVPSDKSPAGLWHDSTDLDFKLFTVKGSNTANPVRIGVAVRQF